MSRLKGRPFHCTVVNEDVQITLIKKRGRGFGGDSTLFVKCDQDECQYVDANQPPCPLTLDMFADEIQKVQDERNRRAQEDSEELDWRWR